MDIGSNFGSYVENMLRIFQSFQNNFFYTKYTKLKKYIIHKILYSIPKTTQTFTYVFHLKVILGNSEKWNVKKKNPKYFILYREEFYY